MTATLPGKVSGHPSAPHAHVNGQEVHSWLMDLGWDAETVRGKYPTKYTFDPKAQEQFKLVVRDYARMEGEKDDRQYGSLLDSLARMQAPKRVEPRWGEVMKLLGGALELGEYAAMAGSAVLYDTTRSPELRNGYLNQVEDEVRHTTQVHYLTKYYASQYYDPAGFTDMRKWRYINPLFAPDMQAFGENFCSGDPVFASLNLQLVAEACFTNPLIVAMTEWSAANGDEITPTIFLSIQSDEMRHMANGYQTIVSVAHDAENMKYLQTDLENAFWLQHRFATPVVGAGFEYGAVNRLEPWARVWDRWVYEDWGGIWLGRLSKFGIESPRNLADAKREAYWGHHFTFAVAYALWPLIGIRMDPPNARDMDWFENNYPGWHSEVGYLWDAWRDAGMTDPANHSLPLETLLQAGACLHICRVCQFPIVTPTLGKAMENMRILEHNGRKHALCSQWCERMFLKEPERYQGQNLLEKFDGWDIASMVEAAGAVRSDGKTLLAQPHLNSERLWTLDDLRACNVEIRDPLKHGVCAVKR
ncbi:methane monooxygenase [Mycobacterium sp. ENV421]|uniref:methane monooxygenase n=1 Tax=Mycobacterium sp. ENV421 TaxID=1213407 RepID=UPI000C9AEACD|nr:methane monooxygenase [Mycobacterium sp. ENV421]PND54253.1 methane monooxygenase [Mycobacterium sp. ENV421]